MRSWPMRGTLHFLAAADARWLIELLAPRAVAAAASRMRALDIDARLLARARRALTAELAGGRALTRPDAYRALDRARIATASGRGLHVLWRLAHDAFVCFGARRGKQQTFVLFDEWLPGAPTRPRDDALAELARRYFTAHGPATLHDFAWWSGLTLADARAAIELAARALDHETIAARTYWFASAPPAARGAARAFALPAFDELFVGYADRSAAIDPAHAAQLTAFQVLGPVIVADGRLVATWKRTLGRRGVTFATSPIARGAARDDAAIARALARYERFLAQTSR